MKNKLHYTFLLFLSVIGSLLVLSHLPEFSVGQLTFKKFDLLADVRQEPDTVIEDVTTASIKATKVTEIPDSIVARQDSIVQVLQESCQPGLTCIEDYSENKNALRYFIKALANTKNNGSTLRIAFYGDSFIEGDVFCGSFRDTLQSIFGGRGVGYVPITSDVAGFRNTIKHSFSNWTTSSLVSKRDSLAELGPSGYCFIPQENNWVEYHPSKQRFLREFEDVKLYYKNRKDAILHYYIDTLESSEPLKASEKIEEWTYEGKGLKSVRFEFFPYDSLWVYGASFEKRGGIYVDNFSLRGNSGMNLTSVEQEMYTEFNRYRKYKLIILQFGLNLIVEETLNYNAYAKRMVAVIKKLKKIFPESSFLLLSISDKSSNVNGSFQTAEAIPAMRNAQRLIAKETGIAFWDMYEAMGGENSMVMYAEAKPALAAKDYTHLNFRGGKKLAGALAKSLLYEAERKQ
jgi:lysophospholipase L1-like esterase